MENKAEQVHGSVFQAHTIHGDVHLSPADIVPDVPVFVTVTVDRSVRVLVQGYGARAVILHAIRPVVLSRIPAEEMVVHARKSMLPVREFDALLDEPQPRLVATGPATFPFTVTQSDPELFEITPRTSGEVVVSFELDWTCADRNGKVAFPDEPLRLPSRP